MTVTLIIPPSGFLLDERVFPSLGVLKVAAVLEQAQVPVRVIDLSGHGHEDYIDYLWTNVSGTAGQSDEVFGITATMPQMPAAVRISQALEKWFAPHVKIIIGGPHVTLLRASVRQELAKNQPGRASEAFEDLYKWFDCVVCGDGEHAIWQALVPMQLGYDPPKLIDADDPKSTLFLTKDDINAAPFPARHLIDIDTYRYDIEGHRTHSLIGQLGCPMGCTFCGGRRSPFLRRVRTRSTQQVVAEVRHLYERHGATGFMFLDDELNVNKLFLDLLQQLQQLQADLGVDFKFRGLLKSELLTEEMAKGMAATGFRQILVGFESGAERILLNMRKNATRDDNTRCVELLHKYGIKVKALMSLGHAGETERTAQETQDWLLQVKPDDFDVTIITVYPGTPYYDDAVYQPATNTYTYRDPKNGDALHMVDVDQFHDVNFYKGVPGDYQSFVWTDALTRSGIVKLRDNIETHVRGALQIPWPSAPAATQYEHSMGMR